MAYPGTPAVGMGGINSAPPQHQEKFDSAVEFLERVKIVYADQPAVYNQFLDIMKGFKTHTIDTTGVIKRVKHLFKGHPELTRGFAAFLPKEYKIDVEHDDEGEDGDERNLAAHQQYAAQQQQAVQAQVQARQMTAAANARPQQQEVGEEHARYYVKKIKNRFVNQQQEHIYKQFLEILHTFHREKHSIQEVYTQVATLFRDHPDLLSEFAHFLPDPNAQQPLQVAHQQATQHFNPPHHEEHHHLQTQKRTANRASRVIPEQPPRVPSRTQATSTIAQSTIQHGVGGRGNVTAAVGASTRGGAALAPPPLHSGAGVDGVNKERSHGTFDELVHFFKLKQVLPQNDYEEFLKLLAMYNADVLSKAELYFMVRDLLRHQDLELLDWFRKFMQVEDLKDEDSHGYLADYDWSTSEKLGPSYRSMPRPWAQWKCSGRQGNAICAEVLNDAWISVPTGTEEGAFKNSRKNQYEELLFKCEDDRFELDLLVEGNASAIRSLELTLSTFRTLSSSALATYQLNESDLSVLTVKAIRRVYGNRADEFIKMIMGKPAVAIPVVLARLRAKDTEWNIARREWNVLWKQIFKKNYHKQLDHRSTTFKQDEKKMLTAKSLFAELRRASSEQKPNGSTLERSEEISSKMDMDPTSALADAVLSSTSKGDASSAAAAAAASQSAVGSPTLSFVISQPNLFADIRHLLLVTFAAQFPKADVQKFNALWDSLICAFFHVDPALKTLAKPDEESSAQGGASNATGENAATSNGANGASSSSSAMDVDGVASVVVKSEPSETASSSQSATASTAASTASSSLVAPQSAPNKPISTELASKPATHHMLFLGNDSFYLLFRYLQILFDRMAEAWMFSEEYPQIHHVPVVEIDPKLPITEMPAPAVAVANAAMNAAANGASPPALAGSGTVSPSASSMPGQSSSSSSNNGTGAAASTVKTGDDQEPLSSTTEPQLITYSDAAPVESPISRYQNFLTNAEHLINNTIDQQTFEEKSRHDFGISCFPLFTIDKLLLLLAKQFHAVNSDETSEKLAGLYHYEVSRNMVGFTDAVYLSNCREVLSNDKHAYVFTFGWSNDTQILGITEVDLGHPSFGLEHNEELSNYINKLAAGESVMRSHMQKMQQMHQAASNFLKTDPLSSDGTAQPSSTPLDASSSSSNGTKLLLPNGDELSSPLSRDSSSPSVPFLKRTVAEADAANDETNPPIIQNELGVKIVPGTFKLRFVGNTEDSLHRPGRKTGHSPSNDKIQLDALNENATLPSPMDS